MNNTYTLSTRIAPREVWGDATRKEAAWPYIAQLITAELAKGTDVRVAWSNEKNEEVTVFFTHGSAHCSYLIAATPKTREVLGSIDPPR